MSPSFAYFGEGESFRILLETINVMGTVNNTAANGAMLLLRFKNSTNIKIRTVETDIFTTCVKGKYKYFFSVGLIR